MGVNEFFGFEAMGGVDFAAWFVLFFVLCVLFFVFFLVEVDVLELLDLVLFFHLIKNYALYFVLRGVPD